MTSKTARNKAKKTPRTMAFEVVKNQIAPCGLWCGSCAFGNGTIGEIAGDLKKLMKNYGIEGWGPKDINYGSLRKDLESIHELAACPGCLEGGGKTNCTIRSCATSKQIKECVECEANKSCKNRVFLNNMHSGALRVGMVVKDKKGNRSAFLKKGNADLRKRSPSRILFMD
jgi:hypothetical protein